MVLLLAGPQAVLYRPRRTNLAGATAASGETRAGEAITRMGLLTSERGSKLNCSKLQAQARCAMKRIVLFVLLVVMGLSVGAPAPFPRSGSANRFWVLDFTPLANIKNGTFIVSIRMTPTSGTERRELFFEIRNGKVYEGWLRRFSGDKHTAEDFPELEGMPAAQGMKRAALKYLDGACIVQTPAGVAIRRVCGLPVQKVTVDADMEKKFWPIVKSPSFRYLLPRGILPPGS